MHFGGDAASAASTTKKTHGYSQTSSGAQDAFLYSNGSMLDLNSLIASSSGFTLEDASAINNQGDIVGYGINAEGQQDAFLLTPEATPEPSTQFLFLIGCACLVLGKFRKMSAKT